MTFYLILSASCLFAYVSLFTISWYASGRRSDKIGDVLFREGSEQLLVKKQFAGVLALLIPVIIYFYYIPGASSLFNPGEAVVWTYGWVPAAFFCILLTYIHSSGVLGKVKRSNITSINTSCLALYFSARIVFLFLYELFFRGILLFSFISLTGNVTAIIITVMLYTWLHRNSNKEELVATIPFGIITALLSVCGNSIWPAVTLHVLVSISAEYSMAAAANKPLKFQLV